MDQEDLQSFSRRRVEFRLCNVSGYTNELLEIHSDNPSLHVLFIPGNPGIISFYKDFVESLYQLLGGRVSITGKIMRLGRWKIEFVKQELQNKEIPLLLVGHSIGSPISIELCRWFPDRVVYCIGLYPFMMVNRQSRWQLLIEKLAGSPLLSALFSSFAALLGVLPVRASSFVVKKTIGKSWSRTASEAACSHLLKYHTMRNVLYMAMMEFEKVFTMNNHFRLGRIGCHEICKHMIVRTIINQTPDWKFMKKASQKLSFLFCKDDHWAPMHVFEE
ncbi:hypothetical protein SDJN02_04206, partial [Cucurbita argyrosperma subsp. argyrosperma]